MHRLLNVLLMIYEAYFSHRYVCFMSTSSRCLRHLCQVSVMFAWHV